MKKLKISERNCFFNNALKILVVVGILVFSVISCSKDDALSEPELAPLQDPLPGFFTASGTNQVIESRINISDYEFGLGFSTLVDGKITAIVVKIPDTRNSLRVIIWDKANGSVLRTESIDILAANTETIKEITPLNLLKNKDYVISINTNDFYSNTRTDGLRASYPFTVGDIIIKSFSTGLGTVSPEIPLSQTGSAYRGNFSFKFQK